MAPSLEKNFWTTSRLDIEGHIVTVYHWPSDRPVYLRKADQDRPRDYVQVPYFNLTDPKISKGRDTMETFNAELRRFIKQTEEIGRQTITVVRCKEVPWLVGFISNKCVLVPATSFINPEDMQESESPNLIERGHACNPYDEVRHADISGEVAKFKQQIMKIGSETQPASAEDIREIQEQLSKVSLDPNLTLTTEHILTTEPAHTTFLAKYSFFGAISSYSVSDMDKESSSVIFETFVAKLAWAYDRFGVRERWSKQKTIINPAHDPRNMIYGWVFYDEETREQSFVGIFYPLIQEAAKGKDGDYCAELARHMACRFKTDSIDHLELNPYWNISNKSSAWDLLVYPQHLHREW